MTPVMLDILTALSLLFGLAFLFVGALGLWRLPDIYHRMHAASKCVTLGISGMLLASIFHFARGNTPDEPGVEPAVTSATVLTAFTKASLVIIFQFVAAPVAAHMLSRSAHLDGAPLWEGTLSDELQEDQDRARR